MNTPHPKEMIPLSSSWLQGLREPPKGKMAEEKGREHWFDRSGRLLTASVEQHPRGGVHESYGSI